MSEVRWTARASDPTVGVMVDQPYRRAGERDEQAAGKSAMELLDELTAQLRVDGYPVLAAKIHDVNHCGYASSTEYRGETLAALDAVRSGIDSSAGPELERRLERCFAIFGG